MEDVKAAQMRSALKKKEKKKGQLLKMSKFFSCHILMTYSVTQQESKPAR